MKKFFVGVVVGAVLATGTTVAASDSLKAMLFPVKLVINGETKETSSEVPVVNINGSTYVPLRFMAEAMDATVGWQEESQTVKVDYWTGQGVDPIVGWGMGVAVGNLEVSKDGENTRITGQVHHSKDYTTERGFGFTLTFYDGEGEVMGQASYESKLQPGETQTFDLSAPGDLTKYQVVTVSGGFQGSRPAHYGYPPGELLLKDENHPEFKLGDLSLTDLHHHTVVRGHISQSVPRPGLYKITLHFHNQGGYLLGSASLPVKQWGPGAGNSVGTFVAVAKGSLNRYDTVKVEVTPLKDPQLPEDMEVVEEAVALAAETAIHAAPDADSTVQGALSPQTITVYGKWKGWYYIWTWYGPGWIKA